MSCIEKAPSLGSSFFAVLFSSHYWTILALKLGFEGAAGCSSVSALCT